MLQAAPGRECRSTLPAHALPQPVMEPYATDLAFGLDMIIISLYGYFSIFLQNIYVERGRKMSLSLSLSFSPPLPYQERILPFSKIVRFAWLEGESQ